MSIQRPSIWGYSGRSISATRPVVTEAVPPSGATPPPDHHSRSQARRARHTGFELVYAACRCALPAVRKDPAPAAPPKKIKTPVPPTALIVPGEGAQTSPTQLNASPL